MPGPGRQPRGMKSQVKNPGELFLRLMKYVLKDYKFHCISVVVLIVVSVLCNVQGTMFMKNLIDEYITPFLLSDNRTLHRLHMRSPKWQHFMRWVYLQRSVITV